MKIMNRFSTIMISIVAGLMVGISIQASTMDTYNDHSRVVKAIYSIVEFNTSALSLTSTENENKFTLYITEGTLYIKYSKTQELLNGEAIVYNMLGQEITRKKLETININQVPLSLQNTCYIVRINYSGKVYTQKVIASVR
jgi:hypothetical protein